MQRADREGPGFGAYLVFSQRADTGLDLQAWDAQARRFFGATLTAGAHDDRLAVTPDGQAPAGRVVRARSATPEDHALASEAEARMSGGGLGLLAQRCPVLWEVEREADRDPDALRVAAVLASVLLGPIVDPRGPEIFGVKTAREKLARAASSR
jgi:hypothetical protein